MSDRMHKRDYAESSPPSSNMSTRVHKRGNDESPPPRSNKQAKIHQSSDVASEAHLVAKHYNDRPDVGREKRKESRIIRLRSFNNWVKSTLIRNHVHQRQTVLDLGCGKGGDLIKFAKARIRHLVAADIADVSLEQMKKRYREMRRSTFSADFYAMDCYSERLAPRLRPGIEFDTVSMQFCMHYAFETEAKAKIMLENVSSRLRRGGRFIGTVPDSNWIVKRLKEQPADVMRFGNSIYHIDFTGSLANKDEFSRFGCRYMFHLVDAVDCPEYLVHWGTFEKMAKSYGLRLIFRENFHSLYKNASRDQESLELLTRIGVIGGSSPEMSEEEWEAARVYLAFAFEKE